MNHVRIKSDGTTYDLYSVKIFCYMQGMRNLNNNDTVRWISRISFKRDFIDFLYDCGKYMTMIHYDFVKL